MSHIGTYPQVPPERRPPTYNSYVGLKAALTTKGAATLIEFSPDLANFTLGKQLEDFAVDIFRCNDNVSKALDSISANYP